MKKVTPEEFAKTWNKWSTEIPQLTVNQYQAGIVRQFYMYLLTYTPIDTGRLRGNWKLSIDKKPRGSSQKKFTDATSTGAPPTAHEIQYMLGQLKPLQHKPIGRVVWIGNLIHYAKFVEFGTVKMSPRAMMERAANSTKARIASGSIRWQNIGS